MEHEAGDDDSSELGDDDERVEKDGGGKSLAAVVAKRRAIDQCQPSHFAQLAQERSHGQTQHDLVIKLKRE